VGGKLAQIGSRLVSSVANKLADEFFKRFNANVSALVRA
jgi:carbon monoxide dehydrogenase subunit G